jgi:hypothetical protein
MTLLSCHDTYTLCDQSRQVSVNSRFFRLGTGGTPVPSPPASLTVTGINGNAIISNVASPEIFSLALTPNTDSAKFVFNLSGAPVDTVTYFYSTQETVISTNCGSVNTYTLSTVKITHHTLDSVSIVNAQVDTRLSSNVRFFY